MGVLDGVEIIATKGRFGPYLKYGDKNVKLPRGKDPLKVTLEECTQLIKEAGEEKPATAILAQFGDIQVINGRYGPYLKQGETNYRIPKGTDAATLTEADCLSIIEHTEPTGKFKRGGRK